MTSCKKLVSKTYLEDLLIKKDGTVIPKKMAKNVPKKAISQRQREPSPSIFENSHEEPTETMSPRGRQEICEIESGVSVDR